MNSITAMLLSVSASTVLAIPSFGAEKEIPQAFTPLRLGEVKPVGWLRDWCQDAANGITGHSDELDPLFAGGWMNSEIKASGKGAQSGDKMVGYALEQAGYWVDGAVRLGHLIDDEALLAKCRVRFETVLKRVEEGKPPTPKSDLWAAGEKWGHWPMAIMGRAMLAEFSASNNPRYLHALEKIYANYPQYNQGGKFSLINHQGRQLMNIEVMYEAFRLGGNTSLRDDATTVLEQQSAEIASRHGWHQQGINTGKSHSNFNSVPFGHAVTLNESAKLPAIGYLYTGNSDWLRFSEAYFTDMEKNEMMPYGLTSAHEHLGGVGPFSCSELCNAVDYSWSAIWMLRVTGDSKYADRVERAMFNAAPSGIAPDFKTHQYFLSSNRIDADHPNRYRVGGTSSFAPKQFPLCCTGNLSRLLPNFVMHLWMASQDGGLAATLYGPSNTKTKVAGVDVELQTKADYPFRNEVNITLNPSKPVVFPLHLRVPAWCAQPKLSVNGLDQKVTVKSGFIRIQREWKSNDVLQISFPTEPRVLTGLCADGAPFSSVSYGPLLFALPIPTSGTDLNQPQPNVKWQFALSPTSSIQVENLPMPERWSWRDRPVQLKLTAGKTTFGNNFELPPTPASELSEPTELTLVPIGSTAFRVSMFGVVKSAPKKPAQSSVDRNVHQVAINQIGYATEHPKRFTAPISPDGTPFIVRSAQGTTPLYRGEIRDSIGDFSSFQPVESTQHYVIEIRGGQLKPGISPPFLVRRDLWREQFWQPAVDFLIDSRSVVGTHPSAFGGCAWRDGNYYDFIVPSLVMLVQADAARIGAMPRQIDWQADKSRVMDAAFRFDPKNPESDGVMDAVRRYYSELEPPAPDAPDAVKLIHWGAGMILMKPATKDPMGDPLRRQIHSQTVEQVAYVVWAWPSLSKWLPESFYRLCLDFCFEHWTASLQIDPWWDPKDYDDPPQGNNPMAGRLNPYKGRHAPGHSIVPNLLMYEVALREKRDDAKKFLDAAVAQAAFIVEHLNWEDPRSTKGHRMSEHRTIPNLVWLLQKYPDHAPAGLRQKITDWARVAVRRANNPWDFRRYDEGDHWTIPKLSDVGNWVSFPAIATAASWVIDDPALKSRLKEIAVSHADFVFGRNPRLAAAPHDPKMGFPEIEQGWPIGHKLNVCARLELCRGSISSGPGSEMFPFNPDGPFRHAEGWVNYGAAWCVSLAWIQHDQAKSQPWN